MIGNRKEDFACRLSKVLAISGSGQQHGHLGLQCMIFFFWKVSGNITQSYMFVFVGCQLGFVFLFDSGCMCHFRPELLETPLDFASEFSHLRM